MSKITLVDVLGVDRNGGIVNLVERPQQSLNNLNSPGLSPPDDLRDIVVLDGDLNLIQRAGLETHSLAS